MDCSPPCSSVHGILQARILEWVAPGDLPDPGVKPESLTSPALAGILYQQCHLGSLFFSGSSRENLFLSFPGSRSFPSYILWLVVLSLPSKITASHLQIFLSDPGLCCHLFSDWPLISFFPNKDPCDHIGPHLPNPGLFLYLKILNHNCKAAFAMQGNIFTGSGD